MLVVIVVGPLAGSWRIYIILGRGRLGITRKWRNKRNLWWIAEETKRI